MFVAIAKLGARHTRCSEFLIPSKLYTDHTSKEKLVIGRNDIKKKGVENPPPSLLQLIRKGLEGENETGNCTEAFVVRSSSNCIVVEPVDRRLPAHACTEGVSKTKVNTVELVNS